MTSANTQRYNESLSTGDGDPAEQVRRLLEERRNLIRYVKEIAEDPMCLERHDHDGLSPVASLHAELKRLHRELDRLRRVADTEGRGAEVDPTTGLLSRAGLVETLHDEMSRAIRFSTNLALVIMDVEQFRLINRAVGEDGGDRVLKHVASVLDRLVRSIDTTARLGEDTFAVVLPNEDAEGARAAGCRWRRAVGEAPVIGLAQPVRVGMSVGVASYPNDDIRDAEAMLQAAEMALREAKLSKKQRIAAFAETDAGGAADDQAAEVQDLTEQVRRLVDRSRSTCVDSIWAMVRTIEARDGYTGRHSLHVNDLAVQLGRHLDMTAGQLDTLSHTAMLHDIGKIGVPDSILNAPGSLTDEQWEIIRRHPAIGCRILSQATFLRKTVPAVRHHHERWDGGGYPDGLKGKEIPRAARVLALADAYDAMTSNRCYRPALEHDRAMEELKRGSGTQFDPELVDAFEGLSRSHMADTSA